MTLGDVKNFPSVKLVLGKKCCACCYEQLNLQREDDNLNDSDISEPANVDLQSFDNSVLFLVISPIKLSDQHGKQKL